MEVHIIMGWFNRSKLNSLPIVNDMKMIRITMKFLGNSNPSELLEIDAKLKEYTDEELYKKFGQPLGSLAQADAYLIDDKISNRSVDMPSKWKLHKSILVKWAIGLGFIGIPVQFIVRTGSDAWVAYEIPNSVYFELDSDDSSDDENEASKDI